MTIVYNVLMLTLIYVFLKRHTSVQRFHLCSRKAFLPYDHVVMMWGSLFLSISSAPKHVASKHAALCYFSIVTLCCFCCSYETCLMSSITALLPVVQFSASGDRAIVLPTFMCKDCICCFHQKAVYLWSLNAAAAWVWDSPTSGNGCHAPLLKDVFVYLLFWPTLSLESNQCSSPELSSPELQFSFHYKLISHILWPIGLPWSQHSGTTHDKKRKTGSDFTLHKCVPASSRCIYT